MGLWSDFKGLAEGKKDNSITGRYSIEKEIFSKSKNDSPDILENAFSHDSSFETQVKGHGGENAGLTKTEASFIAENYATGDFHGNMFDMYFVHPKALDGVSTIFSDLLSNGEIKDSYADLLSYASLVTGCDSLCVRCSSINLPGYEVETKQFMHSGRIIQARTNKITSPRNGSVSFRLDKNLVLMDLFSFMSGNNINYDMSRALRVAKVDDYKGGFNSLSELDKTHYIGSFCNVWQRWSQDSDKSYDVSSLGLCIVVVIRPPKSKDFSTQGGSQLDRLNVQATMSDGGNHRYSKKKSVPSPYEEKYPIFIFENVKILGTSEVALNAGKDPGEPPDINVDFIFRRFRKVFMTQKELTTGYGADTPMLFSRENLGTSINSRKHGYPQPYSVKSL